MNNSGGNVGIGTTSPHHSLSVIGGPLWTANSWSGALELANGSAIGWQSNGGAQRFGIGQSDGGLYVFRTSSDPGTTGSPAVYDLSISDSGRVGIGTTTPSTDATLTVRGKRFTDDAFRVENSDGALAFAVHSSDRTVEIVPLNVFSTKHLCYFDALRIIGLCSSAAEYVPTIDDGAGFAQAADLVSFAPTVKNPYDDAHSPFVVTKSATPCDDHLLGFVVNPESGADGEKRNDHYLPLAIYGYFPAKVTMENGAIKRGDAITSSSTPGYGMKATQACKIVGYALEDAERDGEIQVFAHLSEHTAPHVAALQVQVEQLQREKSAQVEAFRTQSATLEARLAALEQAVQRSAERQTVAVPVTSVATPVSAAVAPRTSARRSRQAPSG